MPTRRTKARKARRTKAPAKANYPKNRRRSTMRALTRGVVSAPSIGSELMAVIDQLVQLMRETRDSQQLEQLDEQRITLSEHAARFIDGVLDDTTARYHAAMESLQQVSETIQRAIQGVESVKMVILKAAKAAELAGKVAAMA